MDHRRTETFFAITSPGLETVCASELEQLGVTDIRTLKGGVEFRGRLADLYRGNLWLRTASRILVRFATFRCRDFPELFRRARRLPWGRFVRNETPVAFRVSAQRSRLMHSDRIATTLRDAVDRSLGRETGQRSGSDQQLVLVRVVEDRVELSIDSSGTLLHRRGYRQSVTRAPLRETLAAGILKLLAWDGSEALADPMCGTGSFLLEGALIASSSAPGLERLFSFMNWPGYRQGLWSQLCQEAKRSRRDVTVALNGSDQDAAAISAAKDNLERLALQDAVSLDICPLREQPVAEGKGLVICNPPYGKRLVPREGLDDYYAWLEQELIRVYPGWRKALVCPEEAIAKATGLNWTCVAQLDNGGLNVGLYLAN